MQTDFALQGFLAFLEQIGERSEQRHGLADSLLTDWNRVYLFWSEHMRVEAAGGGYDFEAGHSARRDFMDASAEFEAKYGAKFEPFAKPGSDLPSENRRWIGSAICAAEDSHRTGFASGGGACQVVEFGHE